MFGTLHWKSHTKEAEFVERPHGSSDLEKNSACDRCRAKKTRCSNSHNGCSRCKRLGKTCTFRSTKLTGDQRIRKASINIAQQERSLDLLIQSSASSSFKDAEHEQGVYSDKRPHKSSLSADGKVDEGERGQQLLAEPPTDRLVDKPSSFDLSFLADFGQLSSDQDGDNSFNRALSPLPFLSSILPSTHPEPTQPVTSRTSENTLSPSSSSEDEISRYLPHIRQPQDLTLLEIGSNATPTSLHASASDSTAFSSHNPSAQPCQCLAAVLFAVEEFEASCKPGNRAELDSIVAYQKKAIKCCRSMLRCSNCMAKRESLVLLFFMTEKIVAFCGQIVVLYRMKDGDTRAGSVPSSLLSCLPADRLSHPVNSEDRGFITSACSSSFKTDGTHYGSIMSPCTDTSSNWQELLLGDYEISSPLEWEHLVRVLIFLQLRAVTELLADMKNMGSKVLGETQTASLTQAQIRVGELEKYVYMM